MEKNKWMKKKLLVIVICYVVFFSSAKDLMAGDEKSDVYVLEDITVTGELISPTRQTGDSLYTGTSVTKKGIELLGTPGKTSVYNALDILPGIRSLRVKRQRYTHKRSKRILLRHDS